MTVIKVSATKARNNFFELLNQVALGTEIIVERDRRDVAIIRPNKTKTDWKALRKALKDAHGILKGQSADEIAPARKKEAWKGFGEWDKDIILKDK